MEAYREVTVYAPASISNMGSGFDIIGFPLEHIGDTITVRKNEIGDIRITSIEGYSKGIPYESDKNVASYALQKMMDDTGYQCGVDIEIVKNIMPGSGIGSSAASSAGALVAFNRLMGDPLSGENLISYAMEGENLISSGKHADNVAPVIQGGINVIRSYTPLNIIRIPPPEALWVALLHPQIEIRTKLSRELLEETIKLKDAIKQWGNVAGLISGLYTSDYKMIGESMEDVVAEPIRSELIPGFWQLKQSAVDGGALGYSISGSGPSVFAICRGEKSAQKARKAMAECYEGYDIPYKTYVSKVNADGAKVINAQ